VGLGWGACDTARLRLLPKIALQNDLTAPTYVETQHAIAILVPGDDASYLSFLPECIRYQTIVVSQIASTQLNSSQSQFSPR